MARVVFLGTPEAAVPTLKELTQGHHVSLVVTQPDRPKGRSGTPSAPPVKVAGIGLGLPVVQPGDSRQLAKALAEHGPFDVGVVVAYGRILERQVLECPAHGMVNVHFSLLPRWRGAAPVARALLAGDPMTGVTIIRIDEGLDTGPVLTAQAIDIPADDDAGRLTSRLAMVGARLLADTLPGYLAGDIEAVPQSEEGLSYAHKIDKGDRPIEVEGPALAAVAKVRALAPVPAATLSIDGEPHKILAVHQVDDVHVEPGTWAAVHGRPFAGLADGSVELVRLQPPGRKPMTGSEWVNGLQEGRGEIA